MTDLSAARTNMVENQIRPSDVTDLRIQKAMAEIPRELFLPKSVRSLAYSEERLEIAPGRRAVELTPIAADAMAGHTYAVTLAKIYAWVDEPYSAVKTVHSPTRMKRSRWQSRWASP